MSCTGTCGSCVEWKAEAAEIQTGEKARRLEVAQWSPALGFSIKDSLFPHISGGLRGRTVTITSIQVCCSQICAHMCYNMQPLFQDFPWTILSKDRAGSVVSSSGLVFAMLDEIASTLNFSYSIVTPDDNSFGFKKQERSVLDYV